MFKTLELSDMQILNGNYTSEEQLGSATYETHLVDRCFIDVVVRFPSSSFDYEPGGSSPSE